MLCTVELMVGLPDIVGVSLTILVIDQLGLVGAVEASGEGGVRRSLLAGEDAVALGSDGYRDICRDETLSAANREELGCKPCTRSRRVETAGNVEVAQCRRAASSTVNLYIPSASLLSRRRVGASTSLVAVAASVAS